ncbi:MAG: hypothetical protein KAT90_10000 [Gammaproteobacteria bacterium]|nr:hypothetical protein [Gammaproteobacteria bacterium]
MIKYSKYYWLFMAGFLGGLAEVIWVGLYSLTTNVQISDIGSAITATLYPPGIEFYLAPVLGLIIHMALSVLLAFGFGSLLWPMVERKFHYKAAAMVASIVTLSIVWKVNFFLLLPMWNPDFIGLLPLSVTLTSKLLFGLTMGSVLTIYQHRLSRNN